MVVLLTGIQYLHALVVQRSLTVLRPSQALHDKTCECRTLLAIFPIVPYRTNMSLYIQKKQVAGEISLTPCTVIIEWLVSLKDFRRKGFLSPVGVEDARHLSICMLRRARRNPAFFHPPKFGDPPYTSVIRLSLGSRRLVNLLPVAQRTN